MSQFADGGFLSSKPYAAGGNYINKMSDYCKNCRYKVKEKTGEEACPLNYLYWDFLARNEDKLKKNPRLGPVYRTWNRMDETKTYRLPRQRQVLPGPSTLTALPTDTEIADRILELCQQRGPKKTICPSEAARALTEGRVDLDWRDLMGPVRQVAGRLAVEGRIEVCQKGRVVDIGEARGVVRLKIPEKENPERRR